MKKIMLAIISGLVSLACSHAEFNKNGTDYAASGMSRTPEVMVAALSGAKVREMDAEQRQEYADRCAELARAGKIHFAYCQPGMAGASIYGGFGYAGISAQQYYMGEYGVYGAPLNVGSASAGDVATKADVARLDRKVQNVSGAIKTLLKANGAKSRK